MERLHDLDLMDRFGSNMPLDADFEIDFIEDFQTLKKTCQMLNPDPERHGIKRYLFFASEMGNWAPQDMPWLNTQFIRELQQVRKYGLNFLGDGIARIDKRILNEKHFHGYFLKAGKANPTIAIYHDYLTRKKTTLRNIPLPKMKWNTWYSATFYMEPQVPESINLPLNPEHEKIRIYLNSGNSWDKTEFSRGEGKRAIDKVLAFHMSHCLNSLKDTQEVTE